MELCLNLISDKKKYMEWIGRPFVFGCYYSTIIKIKSNSTLFPEFGDYRVTCRQSFKTWTKGVLNINQKTPTLYQRTTYLFMMKKKTTESIEFYRSYCRKKLDTRDFLLFSGFLVDCNRWKENTNIFATTEDVKKSL